MSNQKQERIVTSHGLATCHIRQPTVGVLYLSHAAAFVSFLRPRFETSLG